MALHLADFRLRLKEVDARVARMRDRKARAKASEALTPINDWADWFAALERHTSIRLTFVEGTNEEAPRFHNLEARIHINSDVLPLPGFLRFVTGDPFGTRGHVQGIAESWTDRVAGPTTAPLPPSLQTPAPPAGNLIQFPASFSLTNKKTHPGFQTIQTCFLGAKTATAWAQGGAIVGPQCLLTWVQVINAVLSSSHRLGHPASSPPLPSLVAFLQEPDADELVSEPSAPGSDASSASGDASGSEDAADDRADLPRVTLPGPWSPADHRPGCHQRDYLLSVPDLANLSAAAFSVPAVPYAPKKQAAQEQGQQALTHPLTAPSADCYRVNVANFRHFLVAMYTDPIPERSADFAARLARYDLSRAAFEHIREAHYRDLNGHVIKHAPWTSNKKYPPKPAITYVIPSFTVAVEAKLIEMLALGDAAPLTEGSVVVVVYITDGMGRKIHRAKLSAGFMLLAVHRFPGMLRALVPTWAHGGPYAAVHHRTIHAHEAIGGELERLSRHKVFGKHPVVLRAYTDMLEATLLYSPPSYYGPGGICWLATQKLGYHFLSHAGCGMCPLSGFEIFRIPKGGPPTQPAETRAVPMEVRGRDSLELPWSWGSVHLVGHGVMCLVASIGVDFPEEPKDAREFVDRIFPGLGWNIFRDPQRAQKLEAMRQKVQQCRRRQPGGERVDPDEDLLPDVEAADIAGRGDPLNAPAGAGGSGGGQWSSRAVPHLVRMKESRALIDDEAKLKEFARHCRKRPPFPDPVDPSQPAVDVADHLVEGMAVLRARRYLKDHVHSREDARAWQLRGRRVFHRMKCLASRTTPWDGREVLPTVPWFKASSKAVQEALLAQVDQLPYDQQASAVAMAAHLCFEHGFDHLVDPDIPFEQAVRLTEEAGDHWFSYLYYTVPCFQPSPASTLSGKVRAVWQTILEASSALVPRQTGALASRIETNRAYA